MSEIIIQDDLIDIKERLGNLTRQHTSISDMVTPKAYIKKKMGLDYVEIGYMKAIADKEFPGWSWEIIKSEALGSEAYVVHGRLKWYDNGVMRVGDMVAAHRIQKKKGSNDVYRNQYEDPELSDEQIKTIRILADEISADKLIEMDTLIADSKINALNYKGVIAKLERIKESDETI